MNRFESVSKLLMWFMALLLVALAAGCGGGGGGGRNPILGGGGAPVPATLVDQIKPRVTVTFPATTVPGPTAGPAANAAITATFTKAMAPATLASPATSFTVVNTTAGGTPVAGTVTYVVASRTASFKPTLALTPGNTYTATIKGIGASPATDLAGNALAGNTAALPAASDYVWTFIPAATDRIAPTVTLTAPANVATGVALNSSVNATFSKAMDPATISTATFTLAPTATPGAPVAGVVTYDPVSFIATFTPTSNLAASTNYTATVTNVAADLAGNLLVVPAVGAPANPWTFTTGTGLAPGAITLGTASTFGLMATAAITAASGSTINGNVSLDPGTSMTGFPPGVVNGSVHINDTVSAQARTDLLAAYNQAKGLACTTNVGTADLGGLYVFPTGIPPGVYCSGSTMLVGANIVLDGGGNANAVWVFQIGSSLTSNANITLTGGAQAKNVFWVPTFDVTIGSGTTFNGTILAGRDATSAGSATINGRILAGATTAGTIALNGPPSTVTVPLP